jgi:NDP-sugar pyrophosphorylase family protein
MMAVILAGGKGTRLHPFTVTIPKPLLPLGDVPILEVVIRQLSQSGFDRVAITLGHLEHLFTATIGDGSRWGINIDYYREDIPLGTAGSLRLVNNLEEDFLVMNGDLLTTISYTDLLERHISCNASGTIALHRREVNIDYGVIETDGRGNLCKYIEKPTIHYTVSMGINVLNRRCIDFIPNTGRFDMPQLMTAMSIAGEKIICHETDCYWQDIGRFDDYQHASKDFTEYPDRFIKGFTENGQ